MQAILSRESAMRLGIVIVAVIGLVLVWKVTPLSAYATPDFIVPQLRMIRELPWSWLIAIVLYIIGTLVFLPRVFMTAAIVVVYQPHMAFMICMGGSLASAAIGYAIGCGLSFRSLQALLGPVAEKVSGYARRGGVMGITLLRFVPIAPFTAVNIAMAMMNVPFHVFLAGTFLGMLPGTITASMVGFSLVELWQNPDPHNILLLAAGFLFWLLTVFLVHLANQKWRQRRLAG